MLHFYDGQIRRYLIQTIRLLSNFTVKYNDGTLVRVPVVYGDPDKQVANIINQNSENTIIGAPKIAVYISDLAMDRDRLADASYVGKVHIREREIDGDRYTGAQGQNYTVERLMPTPYKLTLKADIFSTSTDQKLQILEQILMLFNPSLEIQTTDNYVDWTSLSVINLENTSFSSRTVPMGTTQQLDIATLELSTPIYISPPAKVKKLGIVTDIIMNVFGATDNVSNQYIEGLGVNLTGDTSTFSDALTTVNVNIGGFGLLVVNNQAKILDETEAVTAVNDSIEIPEKLGSDINWRKILDLYPGKYRAGLSQLILTQDDGNEIVGTVSLNPLDESILSINFDNETFPATPIVTASRPNSPNTFDAIVDPTRFNPGSAITGTRYLIIENIGSTDNTDGADAWKNSDLSDFVANENDLIEWTGTAWQVVFDASQNADNLVYQTNIYTGVKYMWNGLAWIKSFEGEYPKGTWRLEL